MGSVLRLLTLNLGAWSTMDVTRVHITYHFNPKLGMSTIMHELLQVSSSRQTYSHWECQWSHPCRFLACSCKIMSSSGRHYAGTMTTHNAVCTNPTLGMSVITPILFAFINLAEDIMKIHWLNPTGYMIKMRVWIALVLLLCAIFTVSAAQSKSNPLFSAISSTIWAEKSTPSKQPKCISLLALSK